MNNIINKMTQYAIDSWRVAPIFADPNEYNYIDNINGFIENLKEDIENSDDLNLVSFLNDVIAYRTTLMEV